MNQDAPQSKFLQAYERLPSLNTQIRIDVNVSGVFAFPEEWKVTDEANPGLFIYQVRYTDAELSGGKVVLRELTEKEKKEQEELILAAKTKKAPPPKKDAKYQDPIVNPEEEERARKLREAEDEEERIRLIEWNKLDANTKFYRTQEDRFKNPQILFTDKQDFSVERENQNLVIFEERVWVDGGEHIFIVKYPALSEDDLSKLRKSKPKTLPNLNDLYPVILQGWVNYKPFRTPGLIESQQRIRLTQFIDEQTAPETSKPNLEGGIYILMTMQLNNPVSPILKEPKPTMQDVIALAPGAQPLHPSQQCIKELRGELELIMESLAMEYSNMFAKELNQFQDSKMNNMLLTHKKSDLQKRKEHFLYDFNVSGKYKILKERIKKSIVKICRDKFGKSGAITGITTGAEDQFYSELYVFMMEEMRRVIIDIVKDKKESLIEDQLLTKEYAEKNIDAQLVLATKESKFDVLTRLAEEYEVLNQTEKANKQFRQLIDLNPSDHLSLFKYAQFALRAGNYLNAEELMEKALSYNNSNKDYQLLLAAIYMQRDRQKEATTILRLLLGSDSDNLSWNLQLYYLVSKVWQGENELIKKKIFAKSERLFLREKNLLLEQGDHKANPNVFDIPWIKLILPPPEKVEKDKAILEKQELQRIAFELSHVQPCLTKELLDEMFLKTVIYYNEYNLLDLAENAASMIGNKQLPEMVLLSAKLAQYHKDPLLAIKIMDAYITKNPRSYSVLQAKGNLQYLNGQLDLCEETFLRALKLDEGKTNFNLYLRLGNLFLNKNQYGDARAFFTRACDLKPTSSLSWLGLGIACNKSQLYEDAEKSLMQANILEPQNGEILAYLSLNALQDGGRFQDANQALRELSKTDIDEVELLAQLSGEFQQSGHFLTANKVMQQVLALCDSQDKPQEQITLYQMELAEIYYKLGQLQNAKELFQEVLPRLQSSDQQQRAKEQIEKLEYQQIIQN